MKTITLSRLNRPFLLRRLLTITCTILSVLILFAACSDDDEPCPAQHPQVAVCLKSQTNSWRTALGYYATNQLESKGLSYTTYVAKDKAQQANQIRMAVESGCQILVVAPEGIAKDALDVAFSAGIPVIMFEDGVTDGYTALVQGDNAAAGKNAAEYVASKGAGHAVAFKITQDPASSDARVDAFTEELKSKSPSTQVTTQTLSLYTSADGKEAAARILADDPSVDAFYAQDDEGASGVIEAINESGRNDIKVVVGCGGSQAFFSLILSTPVTDVATTLYSPSMITKCIDLADDVLKGKTIEEKQIVMPATVVNKDNVREYQDSNSPY